MNTLFVFFQLAILVGWSIGATLTIKQGEISKFSYGVAAYGAAALMILQILGV